jgi:hypothetical protein
MVVYEVRIALPQVVAAASQCTTVSALNIEDLNGNASSTYVGELYVIFTSLLDDTQRSYRCVRFAFVHCMSQKN